MPISEDVPEARGSGAKVVEHLVLEGPHLKSGNTADHEAVKTHNRGDAQLLDGIVESRLPKHSLNVIRLGK